MRKNFPALWILLLLLLLALFSWKLWEVDLRYDGFFTFSVFILFQRWPTRPVTLLLFDECPVGSQWDGPSGWRMMFLFRVSHMFHFLSDVSIWSRNEALLWRDNNYSQMFNRWILVSSDRSWETHLLSFHSSQIRSHGFVGYSRSICKFLADMMRVLLDFLL